MREKLISNLFFRVSNPLPAWSLGFYRIVFGILLFILAFRYFSNGWISKYFLDPSFHFKFYGLSWIAVFPAWILYSLFVSLLFFSGVYFFGNFLQDFRSLFFSDF
nr:HTTM domain-containing protein [Leptospira interrogans]